MPVPTKDDLEKALRDLVEVSGCVAPLTSQVPMDTVRDVRKAMKFMAAYERANALIKEIDAHA